MRLGGLAFLLTVAAPAAAQDSARLDDFAVPSTGRTSESAARMDQLSREAPSVEAPQPHDRSLAVPQPPQQSRAPLEQLGTPGSPTEPDQLTGRDASRRVDPAAVSSSADSRPGWSGPIGGRDRCDPRALAGAERTECLRILESRAAEFHAVEAPQMSAEEQLLANERRREDQARVSTAVRLRLAASDNPDADLASNQEIAALYQSRENTTSPPITEMPDLSADVSLSAGDLIDALQAALPSTAQP